jgi:phosphoenolpyruvate-protein kinase (PTS system EI component)
VVELDRANTASIVTEQGGEASHVAILARSLGIPAIAGVKDITRRIEAGMCLAVDGQTGVIEIAPSAETLERFTQKKRQYDAASAIAVAEEYRECETSDSVQVHLYANIDRPEEVVEIARHHLEGVGLFRTEMMFLDGTEPPDYERQRKVYRGVAQALGGRPLVSCALSARWRMRLARRVVRSACAVRPPAIPAWRVSWSVWASAS